MVLTEDLKAKITAAIQNDYQNKKAKDSRYSQTRHAKSLFINASAHSRIISGDTNSVLSEDNWLRIGRELDVDITGQDWKLATTETFEVLTAQLAYCQENSIARFFCDDIGFGKTTAAKYHKRNSINTVVINCKKYNTRQPLVRAIAQQYGFESKGRLIEVRENLINNLHTLARPLVILDDAGYLKDEALLEAIALWDELEHACGWYFIGEPAFRDRLEKNITKGKLGWEAWFNRNGERIMSVRDHTNNEGDKALLKREQAEMILKLNLPGKTKKVYNELLQQSKCNLRTLRDDINKYKLQHSHDKK